MNDRDARLLPRLIEILDSADNERELGMAVLQIRRIQAGEQKKVSDLLKLVAGGQKQAMPIADNRQEVYWRLRDLGRVLNSVGHDDPEVMRVISVASARLQQGNGEISFDDLRQLLATMRDLYRELFARVGVPQTPPDGQRPGSAPAFGEPLTAEVLKRMMEVLQRGHPPGFTPFTPPGMRRW